jgi:hypothetical protein
MSVIKEMLASYYPKQMPMIDEELENMLKEHNATVVNKTKENTDQGPQPAQRQPLALEAKALSELFYTLEQELNNSKKLFTENILNAAKNGKRGIKITMLTKTQKIYAERLANEEKLLQWLKDEGFKIDKIQNAWEVTW